MERGFDLPPFLIENPNIRGIKVMTETLLPLFPQGSQLVKRCTKCLEVKPLTEFYKQARCKSGVRANCNLCSRKAGKLYRKENSEAIKQRMGVYRKENKDSINAKEMAYWDERPDKHKEKNLRYAQKNRVKIAERANRYYYKHRDEALKKMAEYRKKPGSRERKNERMRLYRATPEGRINHIISTGIWHSIKDKKGGKKWEGIVGYSLNDLITHLKGNLPEGITWDEYVDNMSDYHIDHKIPKSIFNFKGPSDIDLKKCWALNNLQILSAKDNLKKYNKFDFPFQPSLAFGK